MTFAYCLKSSFLSISQLPVQDTRRSKVVRCRSCHVCCLSKPRGMQIASRSRFAVSLMSHASVEVSRPSNMPELCRPHCIGTSVSAFKCRVLLAARVRSSPIAASRIRVISAMRVSKVEHAVMTPSSPNQSDVRKDFSLTCADLTCKCHGLHNMLRNSIYVWVKVMVRLRCCVHVRSAGTGLLA